MRRERPQDADLHTTAQESYAQSLRTYLKKNILNMQHTNK